MINDGTVGAIIFDTLSLVTHISERVSKLIAPTVFVLFSWLILLLCWILLRRSDNHNILNVDGVGDVVVDPQVLPDLADSLAAVRADVAPPVMYPLHVQPDITLLTERFPTLKHILYFILLSQSEALWGYYRELSIECFKDIISCG